MEFEIIDTSPKQPKEGSEGQFVFSESTNSLSRFFKDSVSDNYIGSSWVTKFKKPKRSISTSRLDDDETEYEEITDENYVFSRDEWKDLLVQKKKRSQVQEERLIWSIKLGLPQGLRGAIWEYLVKVEKYRSKAPEMYTNYLKKPNKDNTDFTISKDILRTFPSNLAHKEDYRTGENKLFNVLKAYSTYDEKVKYWQGMNFIAFLFLENLEQSEVSIGFWGHHNIVTKMFRLK